MRMLNPAGPLNGAEKIVVIQNARPVIGSLQEISDYFASHRTTDGIIEGSVNLFFTPARAQAALATQLQAKLDASKVGAANGVVPLDSNVKIASTYLPSYVDDVLEYATFSALPATGESGKIYIVQDKNWEYRWSGTQYIRIVASPGSTDEITEGSTNIYFTAARAASAAPVQSVGGKTGAVTKSDLGIDQKMSLYDFNAALDANGKIVQQNLPKELAGNKAVTAGVVSFYMTDTLTAAGVALFTKVTDLDFKVNDSASLYTYSWVISADLKILTITVKKSTTPVLSLLGINVLSQPTAAAPDGTVVYFKVIGY